MTYYFVDYENVGISQLSYSSDMQAGDRVDLFYSDRCKNVSLEFIEHLAQNGIQVGAYGVSVGSKNALDFQLSTYLGYRVAKDVDASFVIVSKDNGFDKVVEFWRKRNIKVQRIDYIGSQIQDIQGKVLKTTTSRKQNSGIIPVTKEEMLKYLDVSEYTDELLATFNSYKSKTSINNALAKLYGNTAKVGTIMKKLKPLISEKGKS